MSSDLVTGPELDAAFIQMAMQLSDAGTPATEIIKTMMITAESLGLISMNWQAIRAYLDQQSP